MFAERPATCRPSPSICPVLAVAASFLLGPKLFEDIFTHLLLLAKVRGGSRREMTEGRSENALGRSVPGVGARLLCPPVTPHSPARLPTGGCEDRWRLEVGEWASKRDLRTGVHPTMRGSEYETEGPCEPPAGKPMEVCSGSRVPPRPRCQGDATQTGSDFPEGLVFMTLAVETREMKPSEPLPPPAAGKLCFSPVLPM